MYLPTRYFPSISGAEFYFQRMAEILSSRYKYKIDIYTSNAIDFKALRDPAGKVITNNDKDFNTVNSININRFPIKYDITEDEILQRLKNLQEFKDLNISDACTKKLIKNGPYLEDLIENFINKTNLHYELIHTTFFPYFNLVLSLMIGNYIEAPTICTPFFHFSNPRYSDSDLIEILKKFDFIIACTTLEKTFLMDKYRFPEEKIKVIPMGVDYRMFETTYKAKSKNHHFKSKFFDKKEKNHKLVLFCGYKNYEKGAISILRSIPFILEKVKKVYFVFIGPSTIAFNHELTKLRKQVKAKIINLTPDNLTGYYDKKKIGAFKDADVFLMPSRSDAFGIAFLEAWSSATPVIGANVGATPEVIRENVDGLLAEFDNPRDIAQKALKLLKSKKLRENLGTMGQSKVAQNYTWDIIAKKTHDIYQKILKAKN
ncbi:MAG: glycosyltransferase family 4 protein [Promethearchaeota archaeon]